MDQVGTIRNSPQFLDTPNEVIVQRSDVQKARVLGGVRPDPDRVQDQEIPCVPPAIRKSRLISFIQI